MGYPMTYSRVLGRNLLDGNYTNVRQTGTVVVCLDDNVASTLRMISGDLRRLEQDSVDGKYATQVIADYAGVDIETVQKVLEAFFYGAPELPPHDHEVKS